ncbi:MAG: glycosyltransferase family 1 protein [Candidatus Berkelbacteria bacterium]|nr:glycosyltransferase family 1 protein [Candidatus Berkelbacteria bacterium]
MIIGIDTSKAAVENRTGIENFVYELVLNILKLDSSNQYLLFTNKRLPYEITKHKNAIEVLSKYPRPWNRVILPYYLRHFKPDVYLQPLDAIPHFAPEKSIGVIHDFAYIHFRDAYSGKQLRDQHRALRSVVRKAARIVCVSNSTRDDLLKVHPEIKDKAVTIQLGFDQEKFHPISDPKDVLKLNQKYILASGRIEDRKNTLRLVRAFFRLKKELQIPHKLVLAGGPGHNYKKVYQEIQNNKEFSSDVVLSGHIAHDRLPDLIAGADVFAYPSLYEGFGLPLLEAMACGAAIITSKTSSMPEVAGDAAIYVNPLDENDLAEALAYFIFHPEVQASYRKRGIERSALFSWEKTAKAFLQLIMELK